MPNIRPLSQYPYEYQAACIRAYYDGSFAILCDTEAQARTLRKDFYNFRAAYRDEDPRNPFCKKIEVLSFSVNGYAVIIKRKQSRLTKYVQEAM